MRKFSFVLLCMSFIATGYAQLMQHDYQNTAVLDQDLLFSTHMTEIPNQGGYVVTAAIEGPTFASGAQEQNTIVVYKADHEFGTSSARTFTYPNTQGYYAHFIPRDIITRPNNQGYVIVGGIFREYGGPNGGFFLELDNNFNLSNFNVYEDVDSLVSVVETPNGFITAGTRHVMGLDPSGSVNWAIESFGGQYSSGRFGIHDLVDIGQGQIAFTGHVNAFKSSFNEVVDSDILVGTMTYNGVITNIKAFEQAGKSFGDGQPAAIEVGRAITYNPSSAELVVASHLTLRDESVPVTNVDRRFVHVMTLDAFGFSMNWSRIYELNAVLDYAKKGLVINDIIYNPHTDHYAVVGGVHTTALSTPNEMVGYILALKTNSAALDLRYYGDNNTYDEYFNGAWISPSENIVGIGDRTKGPNTPLFSWFVERFENILSTCFSDRVAPINYAWALQSATVATNSLSFGPIQEQLHLKQLPVYNKVFCPWLSARPAASTPTQQAAVYQNHQLEVANPDGEYTHYRIMDISGVLRQEGLLQRGDNSLKLQSDLARGLYFFMSYNPETGARSTQKLVW